MFRVFVTVFLITTLPVISQDLTCEDFKSGEFLIKSDGPFSVEGIIIRDGFSQMEIYHNVPLEMIKAGFPTDSIPIRLEWISDCSYRSFYDTSRGKETLADEIIKENGGVLTELVRIENRCFFYKSTTVAQGESYILNGRICKL